MRLYQSYLFRNKDPAIDELRTEVQRAHGGSNRITHKYLAEIEHDGGPAASTMHAWFFGKTMRPTNATLEAAGRALGKKRVWVDLDHRANGHSRPNGHGARRKKAPHDRAR